MIKKCLVKIFIKWLTNGSDEVNIEVKFDYDCVQSPDGVIAFGVYIPEEKQIYVAGATPLDWIYQNVAHEYCHYLQDINGKSFDEDEANSYAEKKVEEFKGKLIEAFTVWCRK